MSNEANPRRRLYNCEPVTTSARTGYRLRLEEFFHLRLGHPPDTVRLYAMDGRFRTYDQQTEDEAYGCAIAALVPFAGLQDMLARGTHICRIAEHFVVPTSVVQERIAATNLGHLASTSVQLRLLA